MQPQIYCENYSWALEYQVAFIVEQETANLKKHDIKILKRQKLIKKQKPLIQALFYLIQVHTDTKFNQPSSHLTKHIKKI